MGSFKLVPVSVIVCPQFTMCVFSFYLDEMNALGRAAFMSGVCCCVPINLCFPFD